MNNSPKPTSPRKIVYAYVVGDIVHIGHIRHLQNAKQQGDYLIVGVLTDEAAMEKKSVPVISFFERLEVIRSLKMVNEAIPQATYSPLGNVQRIKPDVLMESDSHPNQPANEFVYSYGGKVVVTPYYCPQSSTKIKTKIVNTWQPAVLTSTQPVSATDKRAKGIVY